ncbi:glycosyltransferase [Cesiribacter sp. SM1]|uniref:glycosyltransferase family 2 protein n=1 Tax=Cesiribacter sp. SM1 TaxID=2861196 RepID=UPI001CD6D4C0|nr:glycosyltransferase [Cesiribacter sp. SM1]
MEPKVSIVIPVKNGAATLEACLEGIRMQTLFCVVEVLVIDSGSTDGTLALLKKYPEVQVHSIASEYFNHGATRNMGVQLARGELVVMTVQDARAADAYWLERMLEHFKDPQVAGVCGLQVVPHHADKNPHEWFRPVSLPKARKIAFSPDEFKALLPAAKKRACSWDDVNAMYRREVLLALPFEEVVFGEDMLWAREALLAGFSLVYTPASKVYHYHHVDFTYQYRRSLTVFFFVYKFFGLLPAVSARPVDVMKIVYRNVKWGVPARWITYNINRRRATLKAQQDFYDALKQGEAALELLHSTHCQQAPQAAALRYEKYYPFSECIDDLL